MRQDKMHLINKIFNNETIRTVWDKDVEKYYISIVDIVAIIFSSSDGRKYWNKLKQRLKEEGNELVTNCHQLKLKAQDGKYRLIEIALADIGELATRELAKKQKPIGLEENRKVARVGGEVASNTRKDLETKLGESVVKADNALNYQYKKENLLEDKR